MHKIPAMAIPKSEDNKKTEMGPDISVNNPNTTPKIKASIAYANLAGKNSKTLHQIILPIPVKIALQDTPMIATHGAKPLSKIKAA